MAGVVGALTACSAASTTSSPTTASASPSLTPTPSATPTPTPTPLSADPLPSGIVNALVFGTDSREKTSLTGNSDAIVLAQLSADRTKLTLVSIARDTYVPLGNGHVKINAAFSGGGTDRLVQAVSDTFGGLPIQLTAQSNFAGFIAITRWLGGIRLLNKHETHPKVISTGRVVDFPTGEIVVTGTDGLIYARERKSMPLGDLDRAERHRALIKGMLTGLQQTAKTQPAAFAILAKNLIGNVKVTGFDPAKVGDLAAPLSLIDVAAVTSLLAPIRGFGKVDGADVDFLNEAKTAELGRALRAGDVAPYVAKYGTGYAPA